MPDRSLLGGLKPRLLKAGAWAIAGSGFSQSLRFASNLLMTRLLAPQMFGEMAIATMVMYALAMFSDVGLRPNVVRSTRGSHPAYLNTVWIIQIARGAVLSLATIAVSLLLWSAKILQMVPDGSAYAAPDLPFVIAALSINTFVAGFASTKIHEASRNIALRSMVRVELAGQVAGLACMLGWVAFDRSIWAMVAGSIGGNVASTLLSHLWLSGVRNRWQWDKTAFGEIFHFGKWVFASSILGFLVMSGDRLLLGGLVSASVLGVYVIAYLLFNAGQLLITKVTAEVLFPVLSEVVRDRPSELKSAYYEVFSGVAGFAYLCAGALMTSGQALVRILYDNRYNEAGWMLGALAAILIVIPRDITVQCFMALGKPKIHSYILAVQLVALYSLIPTGFHMFGIRGAIWAIVLSSFCSLPIRIFYSVKHGLFDLRRELMLVPVILLGLVIGEGADRLLGFLRPI